MTIHITWEAVIAICTVLAMLAAALGWYIRTVVREEVDKLDHRYVLKQTFKGADLALQRRVARLEAVSDAE